MYDQLTPQYITLYFVYGLAFFLTGFGVAVQRRDSTLPIAKHIRLLAAFGLLHGSGEWLYVFIPLYAAANPPLLSWLQLGHLALLAFSFIPLLIFGLRLLRPPSFLQHWLPWLPLGFWLALAGIWRQGGHPSWTAAAEALGRYLLALPGSALVALVLFKQARQLPPWARPLLNNHLRGAALAFAGYAVAGGILVPPAPFWPANFLNAAVLLKATAVPAPVIRSALAFTMAYFVMRFLEIFEVENEQRLREAEELGALARERERIARDLHDSLIQQIYGTGLALENCIYLVEEEPQRAKEELLLATRRLAEVVDEVRRYILCIKPVGAAEFDLVKSLELLARSLERSKTLKVELSIEGTPTLLLDKARHLYCIAQEALLNIVRHARASEVSIHLRCDGNTGTMAITDNGCGFAWDPSFRAPGWEDKYGLKNMLQRARILGGKLEVLTAPGSGTRLMIEFPLEVN